MIALANTTLFYVGTKIFEIKEFMDSSAKVNGITYPSVDEAKAACKGQIKTSPVNTIQYIKSSRRTFTF